ncbi:MAG: transketolase, partial [Spirochaetes bacterium]|nr:transketolase [Spirochaetota bacterium]
MSEQDLKQIANTIRTLSMDAVQKANSGHPGMPMGFADVAAVLWGKILRHNPADPAWINRDRVVLSAGHGSMLLYSVLHLSGYDLTLEDIKNFRQWGSKTPGHPEFGHTKGVETTTGPLGQGFANAVGMAFARSLLEKEFNTSAGKIIDHYIYAIVGDGDIMEGVSSEAASIAGHMGLGKLIFIYDYNNITIEGSTDLAFSEDVAKRFESYNWHVQTIDGHDYGAIEAAILNAKKVTDRPCIIIAKTKIAKGSPNKEGSEESHGSPLGAEEIKATKCAIGCDGEASFCVPDIVCRFFDDRRKVLIKDYDEWNSVFRKAMDSGLKKKWDAYFSKNINIDNLRGKLPVFKTGDNIATRNASGKILEALYRELPNIVGGSADLAPSNKTFVKGYDSTGQNKTGRNMHFGIREHAMGAIQNGIAYYGGFYPYTATFFVFLDYMRPPVRLAALSGLQTIYVFTHDSIFVGEDGPTHQPVEHLASARAIPNLTVIRPADASETAEAWLAALAKKDGPTAILLTRHDIPVIKQEPGSSAAYLHKGAYVVYGGQENPDLIIMASGSEVCLSIEAAVKLKEQGIRARVISFPSWELFDKQPEEYKQKVLPPS